VCQAITEGHTEIEDADGQDFVRHEVLLAKSLEKKVQLEESLKSMFQMDVISKYEYHKKCS
jgi:hypothetical protein